MKRADQLDEGARQAHETSSRGRSRSRRVLTGALVVTATLGCCVVGVTNQSSTIRAAAAVVTAVVIAGSLALTRKRGNLLGWYVVAAGTTLLRVLSES